MNVLDINDSRSIRDFLRYEEVNTETLTQKIQEILKSKDIEIAKNKLNESVLEFLYEKEYTDLNEICNFIEKLVQ